MYLARCSLDCSVETNSRFGSMGSRMTTQAETDALEHGPFGSGQPKPVLSSIRIEGSQISATLKSAVATPLNGFCWRHEPQRRLLGQRGPAESFFAKLEKGACAVAPERHIDYMEETRGISGVHNGNNFGLRVSFITVDDLHSTTLAKYQPDGPTKPSGLF